MSRLFVYGILQQSHSDIMVRNGATFVGDAITQPRYEIWDLGGFPAMRPGESEVKGEVWEVPDLSFSDKIEGHPTFYKRQPADIQGYPDGEVEVYLLQDQPHGEPMTVVEGQTFKQWKRSRRW